MPKLVLRGTAREPRESFHLMSLRFNIDKAKEFCAVPKRETVTVRMAEVAPWLQFVAINTERAMSDEIDTSFPVILALVGQRYIPIDGYHRLHKMYKQGVETIQVYALTPDESEACAMMSKVAWRKVTRSMSEAV